jgi:transcriptional regulator with XRE-family HTH domain
MGELTLIVEARDAAQSGRAARLRRAAGVSQSELAIAIGVTPSAISRWEAGQRHPRGKQAAAYALALRALAEGLTTERWMTRG